jgi:hypothetical protein
LICTEEFIVPARTMARVCGIPDYPFVVVPHPVSSLRADGVAAHARLAAPLVARILLDGRPP